MTHGKFGSGETGARKTIYPPTRTEQRFRMSCEVPKGATFAVLSIVSVALSAGCVGGPPSQVERAAIQGSLGHFDSKPHVVVAVIDTGINPYHDVFRAPGLPNPSTFVAGLDDVEEIPLSFDIPYGDAVEADPWNGLERNRLYWFVGTRVLGVSLGEYGAPIDENEGRYPVLDEYDHGAGTASLVAQANPEAIILMVEVDSPRHGFDWILDRTWVDVVSLSIGLLGNVPFENLVPGQSVYPERTRAVADSGRLIFLAAGNEVNTCMFDQLCGPPWVVAVGGVDPQARGENVFSAKLPDLVADYVARVARYNHTSEYRDAFGTSFSAPIVAGVASRIILELRGELGYEGSTTSSYVAKGRGLAVSAQDVRNVLNQTARFWQTTDYNGSRLYTDRPVATVVAASAPVAPSVSGTPVGPWLQMGWGYVSPEVVDDAVSILLGEKPWPEKAGAEEFMRQTYSVREAYWRLAHHS